MKNITHTSGMLKALENHNLLLQFIAKTTLFFPQVTCVLQKKLRRGCIGYDLWSGKNTKRGYGVQQIS